jgi:hypothetical protein
MIDWYWNLPIDQELLEIWLKLLPTTG